MRIELIINDTVFTIIETATPELEFKTYKEMFPDLTGWREQAPILPTLDELKATKLNQAGAEFAKRRDCVRWVGGYGFDCAVDDITNFMAAFTPLLVAKTGTVFYKVWLDEQTKGIAELSYTQMQAAYDTVRNSQMAAYAWYETIKAQILACKAFDELEQITWEENANG